MRFQTRITFLSLMSCLLAVRADVLTDDITNNITNDITDDITDDITNDIIDDIYIDGVRHQKEVLYNLSSGSWTFSLAVDYKDNDLYLLDSYGAFAMAPVILNLNTNELKPYLGKIKDARSLTVDQETHDLYIGTSNGIYKYNSSSGEKQLIGAAGVFVWYYNGVLYYTDGWSDELSTINGNSDNVVTIQHPVHSLVIDNEDVVFYSNKDGLYSRQINSDHTTLYYKESYVNNLVSDRNGKVYFSSDDCLYEILKYNVSYRKVASIKDVKAIVFDMNNNIIYCDYKRVYRLKQIAEVNTNNYSDSYDQNTDITNNTINIEEQEDRKLLDVMDKKIDKLDTDHMEMGGKIEDLRNSMGRKIEDLRNSMGRKIEDLRNSMGRKIENLSQKIDKLETDLVRIVESNTKLYKLITDIVKRNQEMVNMNITTVEPVTGQVNEQVHYSASSPDDSHRQ